MRALPWILLALALGGGAYLFLGDSGAQPDEFDESDVAIEEQQQPGVSLTGRGAQGGMQGTSDDTDDPVIHVVTGRVDGPDGKPKGGVTVRIERTSPAWGGSREAQREAAQFRAEGTRRTFEQLEAAAKPWATVDVVTAEDGTFSWHARRGGHHAFYAVVDAPLVSPKISASTNAANEPPFVLIKLVEGTAVRGRVLYADDRPVDAMLAVRELRPVARRSYYIPAIATDAEGRFVAPSLPASRWSFVVTVRGHMVFTAPPVSVPTDVEVVIRVPSGQGGLQGTVTNEHGAPLPNTQLLIHIDTAGSDNGIHGFSVRADTNAQGAYEASGILAGRVTRISALRPGMPGQTQILPIASWAGAVVPETGTTTLDVVLVRGGTVTGTVREGAGGRPIAGAWVALLMSPGGTLQVPMPIQTGPDGRYVLASVPAGKHVIAVEHEAYYQPAALIKASTRTPPPALLLLMPSNTPTIQRDLVMQRGIEVRGKVVDPDKRPLAGAAISAKNSGLQNKAWQWGVHSGSWKAPPILSAEDGTFVLQNLGPGEAWQLGASKRGYIGHYCESFALKPGTKPPELTLAMVRGAALEGVVKQGDGSPAPGVTVNAWASGDMLRAVWSVSTDPDGKFVMDAAPTGNVSLYTYNNSGASINEALKDVKEGEVRSGLVLKFPEGVSISGILVDNDNKPKSGVRLMVTKARTNNQHGSCTTDVDGSFAFENVPEGSLQLKEWRDSAQHNVGDVFTAPDDNLRVVYSRKDSFILEVRVHDDQGRPVPLAVVTAGVGNSQQRMRPDQLPDVANGLLRKAMDAVFPFKITVSEPRNAKGAPMNLRSRTHTVSEKPDGPITLQLEPGRAVRGTVRGPDGGVAGAVCNVGQVSCVSDANGAFLIAGLGEGVATLIVKPPAPYVAPSKIQLGMDQQEVEVHLVRGLSIRGTVQQSDDQPTFSGGHVTASWKADGDTPKGSASAQLQATGAFEIHAIPPNVQLSVQVRFWNMGGGGTIAPASVDGIEPGDQDVVIPLGTGVEVSGHVENADGTTPTQAISIYVREAEGNKWVTSTQAAKDGTFQIKGLARKKYSISAWIQGLNGSMQPKVEVTAPHSSVLLVVPELSFLRGTIRPAPSDPSKIHVRALPVGGSSSSSAMAQVKADGSWTMNSVGAGTKWRVFCQDRENNRYAQSGPVSSGTENIVLQMVAGESITGTVTGSDGSPVASGYVMVTAEGWMGYTMFTDGDFEVRGLPPGSYKLVAYSRTSTSQEKVGELENVAAGRSDVRIQSTGK